MTLSMMKTADTNLFTDTNLLKFDDLVQVVLAAHHVWLVTKLRIITNHGSAEDQLALFITAPWLAKSFFFKICKEHYILYHILNFILVALANASDLPTLRTSIERQSRISNAKVWPRPM